LFPKNQIVGIFRGFSQGGMDFHADIVLPYRSDFQSIPMHGQFLLVQLANEDECVLGRITSLYSDGRLATGAGEDFSIRVVSDEKVVPEDIREQYLKYRVSIKVLGVLRKVQNSLIFAASHRRLPHVGSKVAFPTNDVLQEIAGHNIEGADLGFYALGEFIFSHQDKRINIEPWMQHKQPNIVVKFPVESLVSRRSFVFARAGFGKSNLVKLLFSNLYKQNPTVTKRNGRKVPVGTIIFDPEGEYFWPDDKNRPGLCDVPELQDKIVVFTKNSAPSAFYNSFVASDIKLDIRRLNPGDVISIALSPEKQDQQNVRKLKGMRRDSWEKLVTLISEEGNLASLDEIKKLLDLDDGSDAEAIAARSNMTTIVKMLHDKSSRMLDILVEALRKGKLCIIDISQLRGGPSLVLSGLILQRIFNINQEEFTKKDPKTIPTIAVLEEAQSVLGQQQGTSSGEGPYISWVKEGRKFDLGAMLITQQPGSISTDILSQGDNWFIFHLLSSVDLQTVRKANAHFSEDLLSSLLNEPMPGHAIYWSSVSGKSYPISVRVISFENLYQPFDPNYNKPATNSFASELKKYYDNEMGNAIANEDKEKEEEEGQEFEENDYYSSIKEKVIQKVKEDNEFNNWLNNYNGLPWGKVYEILKRHIPDTFEEKERLAYDWVKPGVEKILGNENEGWKVEQRDKKSGSGKTQWIIKINR